MCCCAAFIAKYVLFIANLVFSLLGLAILGLGIAFLVILDGIQDILPVAFIPISLIVLGAIVFLIGFLACCGAIRESRCMLITYSIIVGLLLAGFIWLTVVILGSLDTLQATVDGWIVNAFNNLDLRPVFNVLEASFRCCGTIGPVSYLATNTTLPPTCCPNPVAGGTCEFEDAFRGCGVMVGDWLETMTGIVGAVLIVIIIVQSIAVIFALFLSYRITRENQKKRRRVY